MVTPPVSVAVNGAGATGHSQILSMCTATCSSDSDCATSNDFKTTGATGCSTYKCAVPSVLPGTENFCCQTMCMCADDLIPGFNKNDPNSVTKLPTDPSTGLTIPLACAATNANRCQFPK